MFHLKEYNTSVKTEFAAGLTTFLAMAYILMVNSQIFMGINGNPVSYGAMYISTALSAIAGCVLIGLISGLPLAQAPGMGMNAFFVYTICNLMGFTYANALVIVLVEGLIFILLTVTGLRKIIFEEIPGAVKSAITGGIGLFIAFMGMQNAGLVVKSEATMVDLHSFNIIFGTTGWEEVMPILIAIVALVLIGVFSIKKVKGAVFWGIILSTVLYYVLGFITIRGFKMDFSFEIVQPFKDFYSQCLFRVFKEGFDFSGYIAKNGMGNFAIAIITCSLSMCLLDMFNTLGTLYGACTVGSLVDENGEILRMEKAMLSDATATSVGALFGTSSVTTYLEAATGIAEGGRTGLSALFTALFFAIAMFFAPIASLVPSCATSAALIFVGVMMMNSVKSIEWNDMEEAIPAFFTLVFMPFVYNIAYGIAFGLITYILMKLFLGKIKEIRVGTWIIGILFVVMFLVTR